MQILLVGVHCRAPDLLKLPYLENHIYKVFPILVRSGSRDIITLLLFTTETRRNTKAMIHGFYILPCNA